MATFYHSRQGMSSLMDREPESVAIVDEFVDLVGPAGSDQSDREIEAEMKGLGLKLSHERIRQFRSDEWDHMHRSTRRTLRQYTRWKAEQLGRSTSAAGALRSHSVGKGAQRPKSEERDGTGP